MKLLRLALLALLIASPAQAQWQTPQHSIPIGQGAGVTGFQAALPGAAGVPLVSNGASVDPSFAPAQNAGIAPGAANTMKGSLNGSTTSDLAITSCTLAYQITQWISGTGWQCGILPILPSRAVAVTLNLSAFSSVHTLGYAVPGDGGEATFQNIATAPFLDTIVSTGTVSANGTSGCTNGTDFGVQFSGGTGALFEATVTVAGGVVTLIQQTGVSPGYTVGNVLTAAVGASPGGIAGCTGAVTWTITGLVVSSGSFSDTASNHWQIVMPAAGIDARAFGVKFDYTQAGGDALATDNYANFVNVYNFAGAQLGGIFARGGTVGGHVLLARGGAMFCGGGNKALMQPYGVTVTGQGDMATVLKPCDAWGTSANMYELCNSQSHLSCFQTMFESAQIFVTITQEFGSSAVQSLATVFSNNCQQENCGLRNAQIFSSACRQAYMLTNGYGGASFIDALNAVSLVGGVSNANCGGNASPLMSINVPGAAVTVNKLTLSALSASFGGPRTNGLAVSGGLVEIHGLTSENVTTPGTQNITGSLEVGSVWLQDIVGDQGCVWFWTLASTNTPNNFAVAGPMRVNSCTSGIVANGQPGGSSMTAPQVLPKNFNP